MKIMREDRTGKMNPETAIEIIQDMFCEGCQFSDDGCIDCIWYLVKESLEKQIEVDCEKCDSELCGMCIHNLGMVDCYKESDTDG